MGIVERRERERNELRRRILDAARELFAKRGYEAVTMREIARRIEYSATALYLHFADKQALLRELCRQDFADFAQGFVDRVATTGDPVARLARAGLVYLEFAQHYPEHYRLMFMSDTPPTPPEAGEREDPARNAYVFLHALVSDLMREGLLRAELTDIDLVGQTIWAIVHGAASLEVSQSKAEPWLDFRPRGERFAAALEMAARAVARDPEAAARTVRKVLAEAEAGSPASRGVKAK